MTIHLAENIRRLRKEHHMTQEQLAEALGVTVGAVYKWESAQSVPEITLLVELAEFFKTSVDALLDYGWDKGSMGNTVAHIRQLRNDKAFAEAGRYAEKALLKYPNSFSVVYESAMMYSLMMEPKAAARAITLFERACTLLSQNTCADVNEWTIQGRIASCYVDIQEYDKAVALLKQNNFNGVNNSLIGSLLAQHCSKYTEALSHLSLAFVTAQSELFRTVVGYANAYCALGRLQEARELTAWLYQTTQGLREPDTVTYLDRSDAIILVLLASICADLGEEAQALTFLKKAREHALRFDAAPNYSMQSLKFYHGPEAMSYDDFGGTVMEGIARVIADKNGAPQLKSYWEQLKNEEKDHDK